MTIPGIFLSYSGPIDFQVIDTLVVKLKKCKEFSDLNVATRKRTYSIFVESVENICKHSALKLAEDKTLQPHISVGVEKDKVFIIAGNPVGIDVREKLSERLDSVNNMNPGELRKAHESRINSDHIKGENGAGLGFIFMAFKSCNKLGYSFSELIPGFLFFEIKISLNKYLMRKLTIDQTSNSPKVILDPENKIYEISGESRPPDVREFYDQIVTWMDDFSLELIRNDNIIEPVNFKFNFGYFNSSSGKLILDICKILARLQARGMNVKVNWFYEKDDVDMLEVGQEISRIVKFPFTYTETEPI